MTHPRVGSYRTCRSASDQFGFHSVLPRSRQRADPAGHTRRVVTEGRAVSPEEPRHIKLLGGVGKSSHDSIIRPRLERSVGSPVDARLCRGVGRSAVQRTRCRQNHKSVRRRVRLISPYRYSITRNVYLNITARPTLDADWWRARRARRGALRWQSINKRIRAWVARR